MTSAVREGGQHHPNSTIPAVKNAANMAFVMAYIRPKLEILRFVGIHNVSNLRQANNLLKQAVASVPWDDSTIVVSGSIEAWCLSFPNARSATFKSNMTDANLKLVAEHCGQLTSLRIM